MDLTARVIEHWPKCPYCGSETVETLDVTPTSAVPCLQHELRCSNCGGEWTETYRLVKASPALVPSQ